VVWFVVPVLAGATRPLRAKFAASPADWFDRASDFAIASLLGAWVVEKTVVALPGLAGYKLPIRAHAGEIALWVLGALLLRMTGETIAAHLYPRRLVSVEPPALSRPGPTQRLLGALLRSGLFVFAGAAAVGETWQLWVAGALFMTPQVLAVYTERIPKSKQLTRVLPQGLPQVVLVLFILTAIAAFLRSHDGRTLIADAFVLLAAPGAVLAILHVFGGRRTPTLGWTRRLAGTALLTAAVLQVVGLLFHY
jgi:hypothetical protein